ncbi:MAG: DHH family phosphoesterase [Eubacteriales bacterium]|nr:DHH family phosphoesterase [Eubacteriales bacterium]
MKQDTDAVTATIKHLASGFLDLSRKKMHVGIFPHARADGDALGSALALSDALEQLGSETTVFVDEEVVPSLQFLPQTDSVLLFTEDMSDRQLDLAIAVDLNTPDRLENRESLFSSAAQYAIVDHHVSNREDKQNELIYTKASSTSELVFRLISELEELSSRELFNDNIATLLIAGLMTDTGRFSYNNTTPRALRQAAWLIEKFTVNLATLTHELFERTTVTQLQIRGDVFASTKVAANGRILYASVPRDMLDKRNATDDDLDYLSSDMREADGVDVSILLRESANRSEIHGSVRSNSCLDAAAFSQLFGGGGHVRAAGFVIEDMTLEQAEAEVLAQAESMLDQCKIN